MITHYSLIITYLYLLLTILITYTYIYLFIYYFIIYYFIFIIYLFIILYIFIYRMFCTLSTDKLTVRDMNNSENGIVYAFSFYTICNFPSNPCFY